MLSVLPDLLTPSSPAQLDPAGRMPSPVQSSAMRPLLTTYYVKQSVKLSEGRERSKAGSWLWGASCVIKLIYSVAEPQLSLAHQMSAFYECYKSKNLSINLKQHKPIRKKSEPFLLLR